MRTSETATAVTRQRQLAPTSSAPRRGSEYAQLSRQIKEAGLLERRGGYYAWKIAATPAAMPHPLPWRPAAPASSPEISGPGRHQQHRRRPGFQVPPH